MRDKDLHTLITAIYDAALDSSGWNKVLQLAMLHLDACAATIICQAPHAGLEGLIAAEGLSLGALSDYNNHYIHQDCALQAGLAHPKGTWISTANFISKTQLKKTEFCSDFLEPAGLGHIAGSVLIKKPDSFATFGIHRPLTEREFDHFDLEFYQNIQPHLERALEIQVRLATAHARTSQLLELFERLTMGLILFGTRGELLFVNSAAEHMAAQNDGFSFSGASIAGARPSVTGQLRQLISEAINTCEGTGIGSGGTLLLERPSGKRSYEVLVAPMSRGRIGVPRGTTSAVLFIREQSREAEPAAELLMQLYGLTMAESIVAIEVMNGKSVLEISESLQVSRNTIRTHLKRIFFKTGTSGQSSLVRLLCTGPLSYLF